MVRVCLCPQTCCYCRSILAGDLTIYLCRRWKSIRSHDSLLPNWSNHFSSKICSQNRRLINWITKCAKTCASIWFLRNAPNQQQMRCAFVCRWRQNATFKRQFALICSPSIISHKKRRYWTKYSLNTFCNRSIRPEFHCTTLHLQKLLFNWNARRPDERCV